MTGLYVKYSEDFKDAKVASQIYSRLRDNNICPIFVSVTYYPKTGEGKANYFFEESSNLPDESELVKILEGIKFNELTLEEIIK